MEGVKRVIPLSLGLCLLFCYVSAGVHLYGDSWFNPNEDMSGQLEQLQRQKELFERALAGPLSFNEKLYFQSELLSVQALIAQLEAKLKVSYKDYLNTKSGLRKEFEIEKEELRRKLVDLENRRIQAMQNLEAVQKSKIAQIRVSQSTIDKLTQDRNEIAYDYVKLLEKYHQQEQKVKQERDKLIAENGKLQETLDAAKKSYSETLKALLATPPEGLEPITIPEQDEVNKLRSDITKFNGMADKKELKEGLEATRKKLEELLDKLYKEGKFSSGTDHNDVSNALSEMETKTLRQREEQEKQRKILLEKMKQKNLTNYEGEEIGSLKKTNEEIAALETFQTEIARRSAYLKVILEVSDLLKECSDAIRDANDRNLANLWAETIEVAMDSSLVQSWVQALQDAMDSDFAREWVDALEGDRDNNISQMWTDAIDEVGDINLSEVWSEALLDVMGTPLAEMWEETINSPARESPVVEFCSTIVAGAAHAICQFLSRE